MTVFEFSLHNIGKNVLKNTVKLPFSYMICALIYVLYIYAYIYLI